MLKTVQYRKKIGLLGLNTLIVDSVENPLLSDLAKTINFTIQQAQ